VILLILPLIQGWIETRKDAYVMASAAIPHVRRGLVRGLGQTTVDIVRFVGDLALFSLDLLGWLCGRLPRGRVVLPSLYMIGVQSLPVVLVTGGFIGMVLAVQSYDQLRSVRMEATLGTVINLTLVKELGPVLAAVMLAGRVGSSIAAEIGTMKITEQVDALRMLGADPVQFLLIPLLTVFADAAGLVGGWFFSTQLLGVDSSHYWLHSEEMISGFDFCGGIFKSFFFGAAIAVIACHRGFQCDAGAEGVGKAATESFVYSFVAIMALDFLLSMLLAVGQHLWYAYWFRPTIAPL
jgi:phospholipid/cholesterol/gamma-HCH transport system permease protein